MGKLSPSDEEEKKVDTDLREEIHKIAKAEEPIAKYWPVIVTMGTLLVYGVLGYGKIGGIEEVLADQSVKVEALEDEEQKIEVELEIIKVNQENLKDDVEGVKDDVDEIKSDVKEILKELRK